MYLLIDIFYLLLISFLLYLFFIKKEENRLLSLIEWLYKIEALLLSRKNIFQNSKLDSMKDINFINDILKKTYFSGRTINKPIAKIIELTLESKEWFLATDRYIKIICLRLFLLAIFIFIGRFLLFLLAENNYFPFWDENIDRFLQTSCLIIIFIYLNIIKSFSPKNWFWEKGLSCEAKSSITSLALIKWYSTCYWGEIWEELEKEERSLGLDLENEKMNVFNHYLKLKKTKQEEKMKKFEELLPMTELIICSIMTFFSLFSPVYACVVNYSL